jgi:hypothetical protein
MHKVNHNNGKIIGGYAKSNIPFVSQKMHWWRMSFLTNA